MSKASQRAAIDIRLVIPEELLAPGTLELARADHGDVYHYLCRVRRARVGQEVVLVDGRGRQARGQVCHIDGARARIQVASVAAAVAWPGCRITAALALIKGERMDDCVHKLVELGASAIAPVITERTVVRLDPARAAKRAERFREIARDALRQSERLHMPAVHPIRTLDEFLATREPCALELIAFTGTGSRPLAQVLPDEAPESICVLVGPEGGFEASEVETCRAAGFESVALGRYILRADTASVALLAVLGQRYAGA